MNITAINIDDTAITSIAATDSGTTKTASGVYNSTCYHNLAVVGVSSSSNTRTSGISSCRDVASINVNRTRIYRLNAANTSAIHSAGHRHNSCCRTIRLRINRQCVSFRHFNASVSRWNLHRQRRTVAKNKTDFAANYRTSAQRHIPCDIIPAVFPGDDGRRIDDLVARSRKYAIGGKAVYLRSDVRLVGIVFGKAGRHNRLDTVGDVQNRAETVGRDDRRREVSCRGRGERKRAAGKRKAGRQRSRRCERVRRNAARNRI